MTKKTKIQILAVLAASTVGGAVLSLAKPIGLLSPVSAEDCTHSVVQHHDGTSNGAGIGHVEHWACCHCHTAWADEMLTTVIGNTQSDRSKIDILHGLKRQWASFITPTYDAVTGGVTYTDPRFEIAEKTEGSDPYYFYEFASIMDPIEDEGYDVKLSFYNETDSASLKVDIAYPTWARFDYARVEKDSWTSVAMSAEQWNSKPVFIIYEEAGAACSGTFKVNVELQPVSEKKNIQYIPYHPGNRIALPETFGEYGAVYALSNQNEFVGDNLTFAQINEGVLRSSTPEGYSDMVFAIYNPNETTSHLHLGGGDPWRDNPNKALAPKSWTVVTFDIDDYALNDTVTVWAYLTNAATPGWKITGLYATNTPTVRYSFGQRSNAEELYNGFDAVYGLSRDQYFIDTNDNSIIASCPKGTLSGNLPEGYSEFRFSVYNPNETASIFRLGGGASWTFGHYTSLAPKAWTSVVIDARDIAINDIETTYYFFDNAATPGWKITPTTVAKSLADATVELDYHFGVRSATAEKYAGEATVYDLSQETGLIGDAITMASAKIGVFSSVLSEGRGSLRFAIYNPNETASNFHVGGGKPWKDNPATSLAPKAWTVVSIDSRDIALNDTGIVYYYIDGSTTAGWKTTAIYAC